MTVLRFLFPTDSVGVGDFIAPIIVIAVWLWLLARPRPVRPVSVRCRNRIRLETARQERIRR